MYKNNIFGIFLVVLILASCASNKKKQPVFISPYTTASQPIGTSALVYGLPQTRLFFEVELQRTVVRKGPYSEFANRLLGLQNVPTADSESWQIKSIQIKERKEVDNRHLYALTFTDYPNNIDKLLRFTNEGLLLDLNIGNVLINSRNHGAEKDEVNFANNLPTRMMVERVDTVYNQVQTDTAFLRVPTLQRRQMSRTTSELAREAADQIFDIREWRIELLRGDVEYPSNPAAFMMGLQTLDKHEEQLISLFTGIKIEKKQTVTFSVLPERATVRGDLFHFSDRVGITTRTVPSAVAVWYEFKIPQTNIISVSPTPQAENIIYYRIPQVVEVMVGLGANVLSVEQIPICQLGSVVSFPLFAP
jgi:hypothetical protein